MPSRRAELPLNQDAVAAANQRLWSRFPELKGRQLKPTDDPKYKSYWMDQYAKSGGPIQQPNPLPPGKVTQPCDDKKVDLEFRRVYWDGTPIPSEPYTVTLPDGSVVESSTDATGLGRHPGVTPGSATVVYKLDPNKPKSSVQMDVDPDFQQLFRL